MTPLPARLEQRVGSGGFGEVYRHPSRIPFLVKVFKEPLNGSDAAAIFDLKSILDQARPSEHDFLVNRIAWPSEIYGDEEKVEGYSMAEAPASAYFNLRTAGKEERRLLQSKYLIDRNFFRSASITSLPPQFSDTNRLEAGLDLYRVLCFLHERDLAYGDISSNNICLQLDRHARVFLLDADSIRRVDDIDSPIQESPDWIVRSDLSRVEVDRARFAIFVWRMLSQDPNFYPMEVDIEFVDRRAGYPLGRTLLDLFETGSAELFDNVGVQLQEALGPWHLGGLAEFDLLEKYARRVLFWRSDLLPPEQRDLQRRAGQFCAAEDRAALVDGLERRILLRQLRASDEFQVDLDLTEKSAPRPSSSQELEQLALAARFNDIASHLGISGLGDLERHRWTARATRHALLTETTILPTVTKNLDRVVIKWTWPEERWVNAAQLDVKVGRETDVAVIDRPPDSSPVVREIATPPSTQVQILLFPAVRSPEGLLVTSPAPARASFTSPDRSRPSDLPQIPGFDHVEGLTGIQIIDPEKERLWLEAERRARLRRRWLRAAAGLVAAAVLSSGTLWLLRDQRGNPWLEDRTEGRALFWELGDNTPSENLISVIVEGSRDGQNWVEYGRVDPDLPGVILPYRLGASSLLYRVSAQYFAERRLIGESQIRVVDVGSPTMVRDNQVSRTGSGYEIRWTAPSTNGGAAIERYEIQYGRLDASGSIQWTNSIMIAVDDGSDERRLHRLATAETDYFFRIRAVNFAGIGGSWTLPMTQQET
jgi:hypothetical protein